MTEKLKSKFLKTALELLPLYGLSDELLTETEKQTSFSNVFPSIKDLVEYHLENNDVLMLKELKKQEKKNLKIRDKIKAAILIRFSLNDREIITEIAKFLLKPQNADLAFKSLAKTCDEIWIFAGDNSADFNYYTKRGLLAAIYSATLAYYIKKTDITNEDLEKFINNRISNILELGSFKDKITNFFCKK